MESVPMLVWESFEGRMGVGLFLFFNTGIVVMPFIMFSLSMSIRPPFGGWLLLAEFCFADQKSVNVETALC